MLTRSEWICTLAHNESALQRVLQASLMLRQHATLSCACNTDQSSRHTFSFVQVLCLRGVPLTTSMFSTLLATLPRCHKLRRLDAAHTVANATPIDSTVRAWAQQASAWLTAALQMSAAADNGGCQPCECCAREQSGDCSAAVGEHAPDARACTVRAMCGERAPQGARGSCTSTQSDCALDVTGCDLGGSFAPELLRALQSAQLPAGAVRGLSADGEAAPRVHGFGEYETLAGAWPMLMLGMA